MKRRSLVKKGVKRIILGGLAQGCALAVFTLLGDVFGVDGCEALGAFVGINGWSPFGKGLRMSLQVCLHYQQTTASPQFFCATAPVTVMCPSRVEGR